MRELLQSVYDLPDVSFIDSDKIEAMMERMVNNYEARYKELTGDTISLAPGDPMRTLIYTVCLDLFQIEEYVDRAGKQDLLKYSYGEFLDNLAANRGVTRIQASAAMTTLRFTLSEPRGYVIGIPAGTRATNGNGIYFRTDEYAEVSAGDSYVDVAASCTILGIEGNDFLPGQINIIVDPLPYVKSVENTTLTEGGADLETDKSLAERTYLAPSSYSVAGPVDAYVYWARTYNATVGSVKPVSPSPGAVTVYLLKSDGSLPEQELIDGLAEYLAQNEIRPMTDIVTVAAPEVVPFSVDLTYYINRSDSSKAVAIQSAVEAAVTDYLSWQTTEIGLDINPDALIHRIQAAGAKRVVLAGPTFTVIRPTQVAQCLSRDVRYGGLEDD